MKRLAHPNQQRLLEVPHVRPFTRARSVGLDYRCANGECSGCGYRARGRRDGSRQRLLGFAERLLRTQRTLDLLRPRGEIELLRRRSHAGCRLRVSLTPVAAFPRQVQLPEPSRTDSVLMMRSPFVRSRRRYDA